MIDMAKKYKTRDGRDVRILCVDGPGESPVVGFAAGLLTRWMKCGAFSADLQGSCADLIEQVPEVVTWCALTVADKGGIEAWGSRDTPPHGLVGGVYPPVGHLRITQPAGNTDITKITVEVVPLGESK